MGPPLFWCKIFSSFQVFGQPPKISWLTMTKKEIQLIWSFTDGVYLEIEKQVDLWGAINHILRFTKRPQQNFSGTLVYKTVTKGKQSKVNLKHGCKWSKPDQGCIKLNWRDWRGYLVFAYSKKAYTNIHVQAEVEAIRWVIWVAVHFNLQKLVIKSNRKICIDAISKMTQKSHGESLPLLMILGFFHLENYIILREYIKCVFPSFTENGGSYHDFN